MGKFFGIGEEQKEIEEIIEQKENYGQIAVDILEADDEIIILAPVGGISLDDIDLSFNKSVLTISGIREKPEIFNEDLNIRNSECFWGKFVRNIILPDNLDFDSIKATMEDNLLIITIQKLTFSSKEIKINRIES